MVRLESTLLSCTMIAAELSKNERSEHLPGSPYGDHHEVPDIVERFVALRLRFVPVYALQFVHAIFVVLFCVCILGSQGANDC